MTTTSHITAEQLDALLDRVKAHRTEANLKALREANGITTTGTCTAEVVRVLRLRLRQGYSVGDIAMMVGLSRGACFDVKSGRRGVSRWSERPGKGSATTFRDAIWGADSPT